MWGVVVGLVALALYSNAALGVVMTSAVVLNLVVAAFVGVAIPLGLHATGCDPAYGSSVLLTFVNDAMGFFLFLGLASFRRSVRLQPDLQRPASISASEANAVAASCMKRDSIDPSG